jgi:hypothetical protein
VAHGIIQWKGLVNMVMSIRVPQSYRRNLANIIWEGGESTIGIRMPLFCVL